MTTAEVFLSIGLGLAVNECCDLSPWLARKLVRRAAVLRYASSERANQRAEEWEAIIDERPGKLLKLFTALAFIAASAARRTASALSNNDLIVMSARLLIPCLAAAVPGSTLVTVAVFLGLSFQWGYLALGGIFAFLALSETPWGARVPDYGKKSGYACLALTAAMTVSIFLPGGESVTLELLVVLLTIGISMAAGIRLGFRGKRWVRVATISSSFVVVATYVAPALVDGFVPPGHGYSDAWGLGVFISLGLLSGGLYASALKLLRKMPVATLGTARPAM